VAQCTGTTLKGERCKRSAVEGSAYCNTHRYQEEPKMRTGRRADDPAADAGPTRAAGDESRSWCDPMTWDRETVLYAALGVALAGALLLTKGRR
jgi:hypothetical protein